MALTRQQKEEVVAALADAFTTSRMTVVADYKGLSVEEVQELRRGLAEQDVRYLVAKNSLIKRAMSESDALKDADTSMFSGPVALAFGNSDEVAPAQGLVAFAKAHEALEVKGAVSADGTVLDAEQVKQLASLPSKDQLRGQVVGTIAAPLTGFVGVLGGNLRQVVYAFNAIHEKKAGESA